MAFTGAADVVPARRLIAGGAVLAAIANAAFALFATDLVTALPLRALSGAGIAAVYPVAMKVLAGWFRAERGLAVGVLIGAITFGSALPHLLRAAGTVAGLDWRMVVLAATGPCLAGAALAWWGVREGPLTTPAARLSLRMARTALAERSVQLANLGYLGHMWELYAMWTWVPAFIAASLALSGDVNAESASGVAFLVVAAGAIGCVAAGALADRLGRTTLTMAAMALSGSSAIVAGLLFGAPTVVVLAVLVVWGITVVADSAQFSTAVSELAPPGTAGSALALQTAAGFLLTGVTIVGVGLLDPGDREHVVACLRHPGRSGRWSGSWPCCGCVDGPMPCAWPAGGASPGCDAGSGRSPVCRRHPRRRIHFGRRTRGRARCASGRRPHTRSRARPAADAARRAGRFPHPCRSARDRRRCGTARGPRRPSP